jgi:REP element-mobilizing transposase RayT
MSIDTSHQQNRSKRPENYDYTLSGAYFITIATLERKPYFGQIQEESVLLNKIGNIASEEWERLAKRFFHIKLGAFIVMPNHIHGIIFIMGKESGQTAVQKSKDFPSHLPKRDIGTPEAGSIETVIRFYKSSVSLHCRPLLGKGNKTIWQGGYSEQIIHDAAEMETIRKSIDANPSNWEKDLQTGNPDYY